MTEIHASSRGSDFSLEIVEVLVASTRNFPTMQFMAHMNSPQCLFCITDLNVRIFYVIETTAVRGRSTL